MLAFDSPARGGDLLKAASCAQKEAVGIVGGRSKRA